MIALISMARQQPLVRLGLSALGGLLAGSALYAWNKKMDTRHRRELALVGGVASAVIIWLLLGPHGAGTSGSIGPISIGGIEVPPNPPITVGPVVIDEYGLPNLNYDPSLIFYNPPKEQTATTCGCAERASAWGQYIQSLWDTLDQVFPQGPGGETDAFNTTGVPTFAG